MATIRPELFLPSVDEEERERENAAQTRAAIANLDRRMEAQGHRLTRVEIVAWIAAVIGGLFGLVDFVLLIQLSGRIH
jgi:hypothetical protein